MLTRSLPWLLTATLTLGSLSAGPAQDPPAPDSQSASERYQALGSALQAAVVKAREEQIKAIEEARKSGSNRLPAMRMGPPKELLQEYLPKFQAAAADYAGQDDAIPFLIWITFNAPGAGDKDAVTEALSTLTGAHLASPELRPVPPAVAAAARTIGVEKAHELLRKIEKGNPDANIQALAIFARIRPTIAKEAVTSPKYQAARKEALRALGLASEAGIDAEIQGALDGREKLIDGGIAPDIVGVDLDDVEFKLSDYRGKIVMLDFWGDW